MERFLYLLEEVGAIGGLLLQLEANDLTVVT
jgi:hypothetical protein